MSETSATGRLRGKPRLQARRMYRETPEVTDAVVRLIVALGKRIATEDVGGLDCLHTVEASVEEAWRVAVEGLRATGYSDGEIGRHLGITRQAVEQRWPR